MRWERLHVNARITESPDGDKSPGPNGGDSGPGTRWGHTCNSIKGGNFLYVFGGYGNDNCQTNDVHVFDTAKQTWSKPTVKGNPPPPRDSHSCTTVGNNLFVFGGTDGKDPLGDLYIFDTSSNTWISPSLRGEGPEAREGHSAALIGKRIFIFGGCGKSRNNSDEVYYNDLYVLDTETLVWRRPVTSGTPPSARDSHTCSAWKSKIIVVAGEDASDYYLSDVHILDTDTFAWKELETSGQMLPPRAGHSTVALGKHLFVFGGFTDDRSLYDDLHMLNLETASWTKVAAVGEGPSTRFSVAGDCLDAQTGVLVFIGGCNEHLEALDDMYYLHTGISTENVQEEHKPEKLSLRKELKRKCLEQLPVTLSLPANNKDVRNLGVVPDMSRSMLLPSYCQAEKKDSTYVFRPTQENTFEAKVTEAFHYGYTIETNIGGQPLRGVIFSYNPGFAHAANNYLSSSKNTSNGVKLNDGEALSDVATPIQQVDPRHIYGGKESTSKVDPVDATPASGSTNPVPVDVTQANMVPEKLEQSTLTPFVKDENGDNLNIDTTKKTAAAVPKQGANDPPAAPTTNEA